MARRKLFSNFTRFRLTSKPSDTNELPITSSKDEIVSRLEGTNLSSLSQLSQFRQLSDDRQVMYNAYDEMKTDSIIAAALELYADDATQYDEQGRVIWVESDDDVIAKAGNRLLNIFEIPERCWKHIYQACTYGDYYLKLYRDENEDDYDAKKNFGRVRVVNDKKEVDGKEEIPNYIEYVEDVDDPATIFDLKVKGKTAGFLEVNYRKLNPDQPAYLNATFRYNREDVVVYKPDRLVHVMLGENLSRIPEEVTIDFGGDDVSTYRTSRGKSILQDVYPIQKELQLLEDTLLLNRLSRSSLIRMLEIEMGDMPKKEVNDYLRRVKNLIEQHIAIDKDSGNYKSFNAPGPIDNVIYIPVRNGKGSISVNNLGGDVNVRDIADIDYFNNKRAGALKVPRAYLGDDMDGSGLSNGGSLTRLSIRYARTIKRIQTSYIRAITQLLNLFFIDKKLDYVNKFEVRMTSPSTQEDLERMELINGNIDLVTNIMSLFESLEGDTQKKVLVTLVNDIMKMPELSKLVEEDETPEEDVDIEGDASGGGSDFSVDVDNDFGDDLASDIADEFGNEDSDSSNEEFTDQDFSEFEDEV